MKTDCKRIALDTAIVLGFSLFLLGLSIFYVMFLGPGHGGFTVCSPGVSTSCWGDSTGPIFMLQVLFGGAGLFGIGAFYRKTTKLTLWESALLGYSVVLFFDVVILPAAAFPLLPLNDGEIMIFALFLIGTVGIVVSLFKHIQAGIDGTSKNTSSKLPPVGSPRRKKMYAWILIAGLMLATTLFIGPSIPYAGAVHTCPLFPGELSFKINNYAELAGPPLFSQNYQQFLLLPGQTAFVSDVWDATSYGAFGNNLTDWFTRISVPSRESYIVLFRVNELTGWGEPVPINETGVNIIFQNITFQGIHVATILYKVSTSNSAPSATYYLGGGGGCANGLLLTVGFIPYWGPLSYGEIQTMALIFNVLISLVGSSLLIATLHVYYSDRVADDHSAVIQKNQQTLQ